MSLNTKLVSTYSKSLFQNVSESTHFFELIKANRINPSTFLTQITKVELDQSFDSFTYLNLKPKFGDVFFIGEELVLIRALFLASKEIRSSFHNPTYPEKKKLRILMLLFPGLSINMQSFLKILAEKNNLALLPEISNEYEKLIEKLRNSLKVKIITASPLENRFGNLLFKSLKKVTNAKQIILSAIYNPKLLGGLIIEYKSFAIDASILQEFTFFFNEI
jgi:F-type H+-transporting ATPase subunit delta